MANPQQPELARSRKVPALAPDATETARTGQPDLVVDPATGPIPVDNVPGHHPDHEQDKPDADRFLAKMHQHALEVDAAAEAEAQAEEAAEVVDLRPEESASDRADKLAALAGAPWKVAGDALSKLRDRL